MRDPLFGGYGSIQKLKACEGLPQALEIIMRKLALAGLVAPLWFTVLVVIQSVLQPDYSQIAQPISALAAWPLGWVQDLNFFVTGSLLIAFAVGLHLCVARQRVGWIAPLLLVTSGIGVILVGAFPWRREGLELIEPASHVVGAFCTFLGAGLGLIALSWRMAGDPSWRGLVKYTRACGIAIVALFIALGFFAVEDGTPLHPWAGLVQRLLLAVWLPCMLVLSSKLLKLAKNSEPADGRAKAGRVAAWWLVS